MSRIWLFSGLCLTMLFACGGDEAPEPTEAPVAAGPALDCGGFTKKMTECLDPFATAYSATEFGQKAGKGTDGTVDHAAAAKRFKMLWGLEGPGMCEGYSQRDAGWKKRFVACDATAACDAWVPCMATAMGTAAP